MFEDDGWRKGFLHGSAPHFGAPASHFSLPVARHSTANRVFFSLYKMSAETSESPPIFNRPLPEAGDPKDGPVREFCGLESDFCLKLVAKGKVRELYEVDEQTLLIVATDRISAYDVNMGNVNGVDLPPFVPCAHSFGRLYLTKAFSSIN